MASVLFLFAASMSFVIDIIEKKAHTEDVAEPTQKMPDD